MFLNNSTVSDEVVGGWKLAGIASLPTGRWTTLGRQQDRDFFYGTLPILIGPINSHALHAG
jgi:hypothetical protein